MNASTFIANLEAERRSLSLLDYYEAIESASQDMLLAAQKGDWKAVVELEGTCAMLISQLQHAAETYPLKREERALKSRIMLRILFNDAQIRMLTEPWVNDLSRMMGASTDPQKMH